MKKRYLIEYNMIFANIFSFVLLIIVLLFGGLLIYNGIIDISSIFNNNSNFFIEIIFLFIYLGIHELIHGISYIICGAKRENIKYGIAFDKGILFCKCGQEIDKKNILISVMAPFVILGLITGIISIIFDLPYLFALSAFNIAGCSGDLMMFFWFLKRDKDFTFREIGDSTTFIINTKEQLDKKKFMVCKVKEVLDKDVEDDKYLNKINCNKFSVIFLIIIAIIFVINFILLSLE